MNEALLHLLHLSDPTLPIGGFAHSAGLETYVQKGIVKDAPTAKQFTEQMLKVNLFHNDAAFLSLAFDAAAAKDLQTVVELDEQCTAVKIPMQIRQASHKLCLRLIKIFGELVSGGLTSSYALAIRNREIKGNYCIAFALYANALGLSKHQALTGFYYNAATGIITNAVKLVPLSQQDGQKILFSLHATIQNLAEDTMQPNINLLGLCSAAFDIRSMQHERLYSRLYMS